MNTTSQGITEQAEQLSALEKTESIDALWAKEAEDRLAAYQAGNIKTIELNEVLDKYL